MQRIKDEIVKNLIVETTIKKGAVTIDEAQLFNKITNKVVDSVFETVARNLEESYLAQYRGAIEAQPAQQTIHENTVNPVSTLLKVL